MLIEEDGDIFTLVIKYYSVNKIGEGEEDSDSSKDEVKDINTTTALQCLEQIKLWKLQKRNTQDLQALDRLEREIMQFKSSIATQVTIHRFFKPGN
jgi:hypothetical protein